MPILLRPAAAADIEEAFLWYERQRAGLGNEFLAAVESTLDVRIPPGVLVFIETPGGCLSIASPMQSSIASTMKSLLLSPVCTVGAIQGDGDPEPDA